MKKWRVTTTLTIEAESEEQASEKAHTTANAHGYPDVELLSVDRIEQCTEARDLESDLLEDRW